jgi:hypothetical protein
MELSVAVRMVHVLANGGDDDHYFTREGAEAYHGRLKRVFTVRAGDSDADVVPLGTYYLPIPLRCPYSGRPCPGGGCSPCEYVP